MGAFDFTNSFWKNCVWWIMGSQVALGISLYLSVMTFRLYRLYVLIVLRKTPTGIWFYGKIFATWLPMGLLSCVPLIFPEQLVTSVPVVRRSGLTCDIPSDAYLYIAYIVVIIQLLICYVMNVLM